MPLFQLFQSLWSDSSNSVARPPTPAVNIDGTPMLNEAVDIRGNPFGVLDTPMFEWHTTQDASWVVCSHDFGGDFGHGLE